MSIPLLEFGLGGVGLLLLGMSLLTDGLKLAAGSALQRWIHQSTATRVRGVVAGFSMTALVQSSSAVTVATIGFVNAGLLSLGHAAWLIFGSNVGTTVTGWLVSLVGLDLEIEALALPLVGCGVLVRLFRPNDRIGAAATAIAGFGLLFLGLAFLKSGFSAISSEFTRIALDSVGFQGVVYALFIGAAMTAVMQSSSAAIAIVISAHAQGMIGETIGASLIIGANVGTTATALIASVGATANAKRLALMHVAFNVLTAVVAALLLVPLLWLLGAMRAALGLGADSAVSLAIFHTAFNVIGVLLMWPLARPLAAWVELRFRRDEAFVARPKFLDESALSVPDVGIRAAALEMERAGGILVAAISRWLHGATPESVKQQLADAETLFDRVAEFVAKLNREKMTAGSAQIVAELLGALVRFRSTMLLSHDWIAAAEEAELGLIPADALATFDVVLEAANPESPRFDPEASRAAAKEFKAQRRAQRELLLEQAATGGLSIRDVTHTLPLLVELGELTSELSKAVIALERAKRSPVPSPQPTVVAEA